jgi:hypothetical protein
LVVPGAAEGRGPYLWSWVDPMLKLAFLLAVARSAICALRGSAHAEVPEWCTL